MHEASPKDVHDALQREKDAVLVDVRSVPEFEAGHPKGSLNIPIMLGSPGMFQPNPDFLAVCEKVLPKDKPIYMSCRSGQRSAKACMILEQNGWKTTTNVLAGWDGARNFFGQVVEPGWRDCGLPADSGAPAGLTWDALRTK